MSNAISGVGTQFKRGDGSSNESFTAVAEITGIDGPNKSKDTIDVTNLDSTGGYREFISGFRDGGEVSLVMNFTAATYEVMDDDYESDETHNYQIILPDTLETQFDFAAVVTRLGLGIPVDDKISAPVTLKISGPVTRTT